MAAYEIVSGRPNILLSPDAPIFPLEVRGFPNLPSALNNALTSLIGGRLSFVDTDGVLIPGVDGVGVLGQPSTKSAIQWREEYFPQDNRAALSSFVETGPNAAVATSVSLPFLRRQGPLTQILKGLGVENIGHFSRNEEAAWNSRQDLKTVLTNLVSKLFTEQQILNLLMIEDILHPARVLTKRVDHNGAAGAAIAHLTRFVQIIKPDAQLAPYLMLINRSFDGPQSYDQTIGAFQPMEV